MTEKNPYVHVYLLELVGKATSSLNTHIHFHHKKCMVYIRTSSLSRINSRPHDLGCVGLFTLALF